jgi:hypothetical protein
MSRAQGFGLICGHCGAPLRIRTSEGAHVCLRILFLQCTNMQCGATFRGNVEVTHQYSPSSLPCPSFHLPTPLRAMQAADRRALAAQQHPQHPQQQHLQHLQQHPQRDRVETLNELKAANSPDAI